jgi:hypothetical protein
MATMQLSIPGSRTLTAEQQRTMLVAAEQSELSVYGRMVFAQLVDRPDSSAYSEILQLSAKDQTIIGSIMGQDILEAHGSRRVKQIERNSKFNPAAGRSEQKDQIRERMRDKVAKREVYAAIRAICPGFVPPPL